MKTSPGNILLMVLVIVAMVMVMFIGSIGIVSRELHVTSDATQKERIYRVAEAGVQYVLFLQQGAGLNIDQMVAKSGTVKQVVDPISNEVVGVYTINLTKLNPPPVGVVDGATVEAIGISPGGRFCSRVTARLERPVGAPLNQYLTYAWTRSNCASTFVPDTSAPVLNSFTSTTTNGAYGPASTINVTATYSENLGSGSTMTVTLNNGKSIVVSTINGSSLTATYTVGAVGSGEDVADLTISAITSESVKDIFTNTRTDSTVPGTPNNVGDSRDIRIDTTAPGGPSATPPGGSYTVVQTVSLALPSGEPFTSKIYYTEDGTTPTITSTLYSTAITVNTTRTIKAVAVDAAGNIGPVMTEVYDLSGRRATIVIESRTAVGDTGNSQSGQAMSPIELTISFSENVTGFTASDVTVANGSKGSLTTVSSSRYRISVTPNTGYVTVRVNIPENVATNALGNGNTAAPEFIAKTYSNGTGVVDAVNTYDGQSFGGSYGIKYNANSANRVCDIVMGGTGSVHARGSRFFDTPSDNDLAYWLSNRWNSEAASGSNKHFINMIQCVTTTYY